MGRTEPRGLRSGLGRLAVMLLGKSDGIFSTSAEQDLNLIAG